MSGRHSRNKGARGEREAKKLFEQYGFAATRTGSGICPDLKGDIIVTVKDHIQLVCEVKLLKDGFARHYKDMESGYNYSIYEIRHDDIIMDSIVVLYAMTFIKMLKHEAPSKLEFTNHVSNPSIKDFQWLDKLAKEATKPTEYPIVMKKADGRPWLTVMKKHIFEMLEVII